jgi:CheY-like chemotaxis protein
LVIEAPNRVLFVDDQSSRLDALREAGVLQTEVVHAASALDGIDAVVDGGPWDVVFLDHDLDTKVYDPYPREVTGQDVARVLAGMAWRPRLVVVHSMNPVGAASIEAVLRDAGIRCLILPMSTLAAFKETHGTDRP